MLGPLAIIRATQAVLVALVVLVDPLRVAAGSARSCRSIAAIGVLDMTATGAFILAVQTGSLAVASIVSALYPVVTVLLAAMSCANGSAVARRRDRSRDAGHRPDRCGSA